MDKTTTIRGIESLVDMLCKEIEVAVYISNLLARLYVCQHHESGILLWSVCRWSSHPPDVTAPCTCPNTSIPANENFTVHSPGKSLLVS